MVCPRFLLQDLKITDHVFNYFFYLMKEQQQKILPPEAAFTAQL